ncbi:MAG: hypothetical protein AAFV95_21170 [Bacteroidota bacterium]
MEPSDTQLSQFVYGILNDTLDAILASRIEQEQKYFELLEDQLLSAEEFISKHQLKEEIKSQFKEGELEGEEMDDLLQSIYQERIRVLNNLLESGPPKLRVEAGHIKIKLAFSPSGERTVGSGKPDQLIRDFSKVKAAAKLPPKAKPSDLRSKVQLFKKQQMGKLTGVSKELRSPPTGTRILLPDPTKKKQEGVANLFGEIEIRFSVE